MLRGPTTTSRTWAGGATAKGARSVGWPHTPPVITSTAGVDADPMTGPGGSSDWPAAAASTAAAPLEPLACVGDEARALPTPAMGGDGVPVASRSDWGEAGRSSPSHHRTCNIVAGAALLVSCPPRPAAARSSQREARPQVGGCEREARGRGSCARDVSASQGQKGGRGGGVACPRRGGYSDGRHSRPGPALREREREKDG